MTTTKKTMKTTANTSKTGRGYGECGCRDCFEIACSEELCWACEDAGCSCDGDAGCAVEHDDHEQHGYGDCDRCGGTSFDGFCPACADAAVSS